MSYEFDYKQHLAQLVSLFLKIEEKMPFAKGDLARLIKKYPRAGYGNFSKTQLIKAYKELAGSNGLKPFNSKIIKQLQMKPIRTSSGVAPVTVLTKPFPCPGKCIFCPSDVRMPKSYLSNEPGAQRAERSYFDPYLQTRNRLDALHSMGHEVDKVELIILGGTWSFYPESYQIWFISECFRAMNEFGINNDKDRIINEYSKRINDLKKADEFALTNDPKINKEATDDRQIKGQKIEETYNQIISKMYVAPERKLGLDKYQTATWQELEKQHIINETSKTRNVGLVIETRPDNISQEEVIRVRRLGCTKVQIGVQSLQDSVLEKNHRGHDVAATRRAFELLRLAGFKIHAHWMANLYGSTVELDKSDYKKLFDDEGFKPDELKIYPCSLIESAQLMQYYKKGLWEPYNYDQLLEILTFTLLNTPQFCRLTRVIRDIPSPDIVAGNKKTNFRQIAQQYLEKIGKQSQDIRAREIRQEKFDFSKVKLEIIEYKTSVSREFFLQYIVDTDHQKRNKILGFLRLSLPTKDNFINELDNSSMIREIHVYGKSVGLGKDGDDNAQHIGFGKKLIEKAKEISQKAGYKKMAVISAIGTKEYYRNRGFEDGALYQHINL